MVLEKSERQVQVGPVLSEAVGGSVHVLEGAGDIW
jgi:hypothetical protein